MHTNMHINSNSSPPFCQSSTKGLKTIIIEENSSPPKCSKQRSNKLFQGVKPKSIWYQLKITNFEKCQILFEIKQGIETK